MMSNLIRTSLLLTGALALFSIPIEPARASIQLDIGPDTNTFTGMTRGYWFTAPVDFTITGLRVPTDRSTANQDVEVVRLNANPPSYNGSTNDFTSLFRATNVAGNSFISTNVSFSAGDIVGILGSRGSNSTNSYGAEDYATTLGGQAIVLRRFGMQFDLRNTPARDVWTEDFLIGRVDMEYTLGSAVPEPSSIAMWGLAALGGVGLVVRRRRKQSRPSSVS